MCCLGVYWWGSSKFIKSAVWPCLGGRNAHNSSWSRFVPSGSRSRRVWSWLEVCRSCAVGKRESTSQLYRSCYRRRSCYAFDRHSTLNKARNASSLQKPRSTLRGFLYLFLFFLSCKAAAFLFFF